MDKIRCTKGGKIPPAGLHGSGRSAGREKDTWDYFLHTHAFHDSVSNLLQPPLHCSLERAT